MAILLVFSPGIVFALYQLFFSPIPVKPRSQLFGWATLAVGAACVLGLIVLTIRDRMRSRQ